MPLESPTLAPHPIASAQKQLFVIAPDFPPETLPTANRTAKLLKYLKQTWKIQVLTGTPKGALEDLTVHVVRSWYPAFVIRWLAKFKLEKFTNWFIYPDDRIFWLIPALFQAYRLIKQQQPSCIVVFMMPYSAGLLGIALKWLTKIPLVLNLDDSPTCIDMHPVFPSWLHYQFSRWLENFYIQQADRVIYVSQVTLETVKARQPLEQRSKLRLVRYGADPEDFAPGTTSEVCDRFNIVYVGGMTGWYHFYHSNKNQSFFKQLYRRWMQLGCHHQHSIDHSSSSPMYVGAALNLVLAQHPEWQGNVQMTIYGNRYSEFVIEQALENQRLQHLISVQGSISNRDVLQVVQQADLLFMALPDRTGLGGRISAKTYEYLMSDRPILAAIPQGENWNYLEDKPGVWRVSPKDVEAMSKVIEQLVCEKFSGKRLGFDRTHLQAQLSYVSIAETFSQILSELG